MSKALSLDLRVRVLAAVAAGLSHRAAAARFGVSAASVSRWRRRARLEGDPGPRAAGGDRRSGRIEAHRALVLGLVAESPDITIEELRRLLAGRGLGFGYGTIQRFLMRHGMTRKKKTGHASEQDRPDVLARRRAWRDGQAKLDPARLVFIDETWAKTNMARAYGRAPRGERLRMGQPHGHWKTSTFVAGLTLRGMIAPFVLDRPINRVAFETYLEKVLVPELRAGDIVVMDNLSSHKGPRSAEGSRPPVPNSSSCRPTLPTSTPSKWPSPSSRRCSARPQSAPSRGCGMQSAASSKPSTPGMQKLLRRRRL